MAATASDEQRPAGAGARAAASRAPRAGTRIHVGEMVSASGALALLVDLFSVKWYGVAGVPDPTYARPALSIAENGWDGLSIVRWVVLITVVVALGSVVLHASQRDHGVRTDTSAAVTLLGALTSLLLVYRVLLVLPPGSGVVDQKLGAVLGVLCALAITLGGMESISERRALAARARRRAAGR
jgi:hypothetical protein